MMYSVFESIRYVMYSIIMSFWIMKELFLISKSISVNNLTLFISYIGVGVILRGMVVVCRC